METHAESAVDELEAEFGDTLRAIATYDRDGYEVQYLGAKAEANYDELDLDAIYDDVVLQDLERPFQEQLFDDLGDVRGKIRLFEDGTVAHFWPTGERKGVFVGFDADADPGVRSLFEMVGDVYD